MNISKYNITNIRRGNNGRENIVYAEFRDDKGELVISATLDYIINRVEKMSFESYLVIHDKIGYAGNTSAYLNGGYGY